MKATNNIPREVLLRAVKLIKQWHDFPLPAETAPERVFKIYYEHAPEMKSIREVLGSYDEIKDEVISATSETIEP